MHAHRTRLAAAAAVLALAAPLSTITVPAQAGVQEQRSISIRGIEPRHDRFFIKGKVEPSYENRAAIIQRRVGRTGHWNAWKTFRTNDRSRYRQKVTALRQPGRVYYRVKVNASGDYATSFSGALYIRTYRA
jgi:hypothetical protein